MNLEIHHFSAEELWKEILYWKDFVQSANSDTNRAKLSYDDFAPKHPVFENLFNKQNLSDHELAAIKYKFIHEIYNKKELRQHDDFLISEVFPELQNAEDKLKKILTGPSFQYFNKITLSVIYGDKATYGIYDKYAEITFGIKCFDDNKKQFAIKRAIHEYIHILIQDKIINKFKVPQHLKERIVDLIGWWYFRKPMQQCYRNSFADNYITQSAVKKDLSAAVQKMMIDYNQMQASLEKSNS